MYRTSNLNYMKSYIMLVYNIILILIFINVISIMYLFSISTIIRSLHFKNSSKHYKYALIKIYNKKHKNSNIDLVALKIGQF